MKDNIIINFHEVNQNFNCRPLQVEAEEFKNSRWSSIYRYIQAFLPSKNLSITPNKADVPPPKVNILFLKMENLYDATFYNNLTLSGAFRSIEKVTDKSTEQKQDNKVTEQYCPLITIGVDDIMSLYEKKDEASPNTTYLEGLIPDPRFKYFDSSIWNRYVALDHDFEKNFGYVLDRMIYGFEKGLYYSKAARATLEFQSRMMRNSFITKVGEQGHHENVTPFKFHSESQMKLEADKIQREFFEQEQENGQKLIDAIKWNFLLVDDQADENISAVEKGACTISKKTLIEELLNDFKIEVTPPLGQDSSKDIIHKSKEQLGEKIFDVILLDYLLGAKSSEKGREYGHDFLLNLLNDSKESGSNFKRGPLGYFWLFPISSFPHAFIDKMRQIGISHYNAIWHISQGGDPISTPEFFRYHVLKFIKRQITECFLNEKAMVRLFGNYSYIHDHAIWCARVKHKLDELDFQNKLISNEAEGNKPSTFAEKMEVFIQDQSEYKEIIKKIRLLLDTLEGWNEQNNHKTRIIEQLQKEFTPSIYKEAIQLLKKKIDTFINKSHDEANNYLEKEVKIDALNIDLQGRKLFKLPSELANRKKVRTLRLNNNYFEELGELIVGLKDIRRLNISYNQLSNYGNYVETLLKLEYLNHLDLRENQIKSNRKLIAQGEENVKELLNDIIKNRETLKDIIEQLEQDVRSFIERGKTEEAIDLFSDRVNRKNLKEMKNYATEISSRFSRLKDQELRRTINKSDYEIKISEIRKDLLEYIQKEKKHTIQNNL